ncbi:MAG: VPLPA-CTERM sorting domain-containing protein [Gammaproteobacteria bacterium]|jgi:hypothetical protein
MNRVIAITLVAVAGVLSAGAQAAPVTIDFEEFNVGDGGGSVYDTPVLTSQGYELTGYGGPGGPYTSTEVLIGTNTGGTNAYGGSISGFGQDGFGIGTGVRFERADGGAFAIHSLDMFLDSDIDGFASMTGVVGGFSRVADLSVPVGTGDWLNLQYIRWDAEGNGFGLGYATVEIDNLVVSAVPIPAAAWLFGSALAGLGWLRRKQAA